ncbi:MAG: hypothetical protein IPG93_26050 [Burkholderiales bacterium]|nr:hypothetical protein [Burkholderiales bacterium]
MTMFVMGSVAVSESPSGFRMLIAAMLAVAVLAWRYGKAVADSAFEAVGFGVGRLMVLLPLAVRLLLGITGALLVLFLLRNKPWIFLVACLFLIAIDAFAAMGPTLAREPRLLFAAPRSLVTIEASVWGWESNLVLALISFGLARRAFRMMIEGMTIAEAEDRQRARDRETARVYENVLAAGLKPEDGQIFLYLRPFAITGQLGLGDGKFLDAADGTAVREEHDAQTQQWRRTEMPMISVGVGVGEGPSLFEQNAEMESLIERALRDAGTLLALGSPGEAIGAGRLPTEEGDWCHAVALLMDASTICMVVPSAHLGTLWEIKELVERGHLSKCCIFMPPTIDKRSYSGDWKAAQDALRGRLELPDYSPQGGFFRLCSNEQESTRASVVARQPKSNADAIALIVQTLFPELPPWEVASEDPAFTFANVGLKMSSYVSTGDAR